MFPDVKEFTLDTPIWNVRTNAFYAKLGYKEAKRDEECVFYSKKRGKTGFRKASGRERPERQ